MIYETTCGICGEFADHTPVGYWVDIIQGTKMEVYCWGCDTSYIEPSWYDEKPMMVDYCDRCGREIDLTEKGETTIKKDGDIIGWCCA